MKRNKAIDQVLKNGSVRQKIKLYMTDIALVNVDFSSIEFTDDLDIKGTTLLTAKEREQLWESIKTPKDVAYYEELRRLNSVFLFFKEKASVDFAKLWGLYFAISGIYTESMIAKESVDTLNKLLDLYPDAKTRDKAYKIALDETPGSIPAEEGGSKRLGLDASVFYDNYVKSRVEDAIRGAKACKEYIGIFKRILKKDLPLKPYREWVEKEEERLKKLVEFIYDSTSDSEYYPEGFPIFPQYEEIEVNITEEDVEDFKSSQL